MAETAGKTPKQPIPASEILFEKKRPNIERLYSFGFELRDSSYVYAANVMDGQFHLVVSVTDVGKVSTVLTEAASGEEYILHRIPGANGAFVGRVKEEYEMILQTISEQCFEPDVFKSDAAKQVIQYVKDTYQDELEFLWKRFPDNAIFRRQDTGKMVRCYAGAFQAEIGAKFWRKNRHSKLAD